MIFSAGLPTGMEGLTYPIPFSSPDALVKIAKHAEAMGFNSVWGNDHMTTQHYVREEFPTPPRFWEPLVAYAYLAAETTRLRFGTGVLVLPMRRDIVVTAKQIATLDHFSGGRLEIGVGVGAYREEFEALNPDGNVHRGDMVEEGVDALNVLFRDRVASFEGKYYKFKDVEFFPKPLQKKIPIYFGGNNANHLRRTAEAADGWIPAGLELNRLKASIISLKGMAEKNGRDPKTLRIAPQFAARIETTHEKAVERFHASQMYKHLNSLRTSTLKDQGAALMEDINLVGSVEEVREKALKLRDVGVTHLLGIYFAANDLQDLLDQMQRFAEDVAPVLA